MSKKVMIITYNDTGGCFIKTYHEGEVNVEHKEKSAKHRSKTFEGIAEAMAEQWSAYLTT